MTNAVEAPAPTAPEKPKRTVVRTVAGRRTIAIKDERYVFEMRADGVRIRRWHAPARKARTLTWLDLVTTALGQRLLPLEPVSTPSSNAKV